jgi:hypothetical protein
MVPQIKCILKNELKGYGISDDLNGVVVGYTDCYSKGLGFKSRVSHGAFQKVLHWINNPVL